ncbi:MAG TPA: mycothiol system anti-sigma-R factor [Propionicimonas sp.]|nr:mycothiol system anti-sigma-R factor [Propionicimonas sp.]HRA05498.1 mycothiol system anti-sigma-R factor [Propionicimonas sp.]
MVSEFEDCSEVLRNLYAFHDNELTPAEADEIRHHLLACEHCLDHYDVEAAMRLLIRNSCCQAAPETLRLRVQATYSQTIIISQHTAD